MKLHYVCPFCFSEHKIYDVEFACDMRKICGKKDADGNVLVPAGAGEDDPKMAAYKGVPRIQGPHHFRAPSSAFTKFSMPDKAVCDWCNQVSHTRVCPDCHNPLPVTIDTDQEAIVALIGTRGSGKSTYVGVLIHEMMKRLFRPFNGTFQLYGPEDQQQYKERFEEDLYRLHHLIPQTQSHIAGQTVTENRPILGTLKLQSTGLFKKIQAMTLVFFDSAGEDWESEEAIRILAKYVSHSSGIIFLIDPLANSAVRSAIDDEEAVRTSTSVDEGEVSEPAEVLNRVADLIRRDRNMKQTDKIDIPVAAAFSKLDVLEDAGILPPGSALAQPSPHVQLGKFDDADRQAVDQEMRGLLSTWNQGDFLSALNMNYTTNSCMAFSAIGRAPEQNNEIAPPVPKRIEDAMFWILHIRGLI